MHWKKSEIEHQGRKHQPNSKDSTSVDIIYNYETTAVISVQNITNHDDSSDIVIITQ